MTMFVPTQLLMHAATNATTGPLSADGADTAYWSSWPIVDGGVGESGVRDVDCGGCCSTVTAGLKMATDAGSGDGSVAASGLRWVQYVGVPLIVGLGVAANLLALVVYVASRLRRLSCSIYLSALAVSDSGFLLCLLWRWVYGGQRTAAGWPPYLCPLNYYLTGVSSVLSLLCVLGYTTERYIATCWPLHRKTWCTKRRASLVVGFGAALALVTFAPTLFMFEVRAAGAAGCQCQARRKYGTVLKWSSVVTLCVLWILPTAVTIVLNGKIIAAILRRQRRACHDRRRSDRSSSGSLDSRHLDAYAADAPPPPPPARPFASISSGTAARRSHHRITRMLVVSSSAFVVMGLPYEILKEYHYFRFDSWSLDGVLDEDYSLTYKALVVFVYHLYYLNFGIDFFIYNLAGKNFREALGEVLRLFGKTIVKKASCERRRNDWPSPVHV